MFSRGQGLLHLFLSLLFHKHMPGQKYPLTLRKDTILQVISML